MAGIIKGDRWVETGAPPTAAFNLEDLTKRAEGYLSQVREQAAQIIATAKSLAEQQSEQIAQQAREQGREAALREARQTLSATLDQQLTTLLPALQAAIEDIRDSKAAWLKHWERQTLTLATAIAERVIRRELREVPEITIDLVREALQLVLGSGHVTVQLAPTDFEALRDRVIGVEQQLNSIASTSVVADPAVTPGGCRVLTEFGWIDQCIESQLARIQEELA